MAKWHKRIEEAENKTDIFLRNLADIKYTVPLILFIGILILILVIYIALK